MTIPGQITPAVITAADVMRQVDGVGRDVAAARGELATVSTRLAVVDLRVQNASQAAADHEERIRRLERFAGKLLGVGITVSLVSGLLSGVIGYAFGHLH